MSATKRKNSIEEVYSNKKMRFFFMKQQRETKESIWDMVQIFETQLGIFSRRPKKGTE